jgi:membrane associated rhomboid family serine protease
VDRLHIRFALLLTFAVLIVVWGVFLIDEQFQLGLNRFGNRPLRWNGIIGIVSMPFLHGGWEHISGNTFSFFTLSSMLVYFYRGTGIRVLAWSWFGSGLLLWMSGASGNHIGLSGVIYALAAFLFMSGIVRKQPHLMRVALVVVFLYGSIVWGVLPIEVGVSWQGHLAGACTGSFLALALRKEGPQAPFVDEADGEGPDDVHSLQADVAVPASDRSFQGEHPPRVPNPRQGLIWKGNRPATMKLRPLSQRGVRKPRKGPHLKSKGGSNPSL